MKKINLAKWPFLPLALFSVGLSIIHGIAQNYWAAIRYRTLGPRPPAAKALIGFEILVQMILLTVAAEKVCGQERSQRPMRYVLGEIAVLGAWILVSFIL